LSNEDLEKPIQQKRARLRFDYSMKKGVAEEENGRQSE
jgi:hypothetical protein